MKQSVSKSEFKTQLLQYLRLVEKKKQPLVVTHDGKPVVQVIPYKQPSLLESLRKSVLSYKNPTKPVGEKDWQTLR